MNELDHVRRVLRRVDDEMDQRRLLDRIRARDASGEVLRIPVSPVRDRTAGRPGPHRTLVAAVVAAAFAIGGASLAHLLTPVPGPAGPTSSGSAATHPPPEPSAPGPTRDGHRLPGRVATAMIGQVACARTGPQGIAPFYLLHVSDGTWSNVLEGTRVSEREQATQRLALDELLRLATASDGAWAVNAWDDSARPLQLEVTPGGGSGLAEMTLTVDPETWLPTRVAVLAADGRETAAMLDLAWYQDCDGPEPSPGGTPTPQG